MRAFLPSLILGAFSALTGVLMSVPSVWTIKLLSRPGVAISEWPWIPIGTGVAAIALSRGRAGRKYRIGGWLGLIGVMLGMRPLWHVPATLRRNAKAMRPVLDSDLPPDALTRSTRARLDYIGQIRQRRAATVRVTHDVLLHVIDEHELRADLYQSAFDSAERHPAIISVHGGSWNGGDKGGLFQAHHRWLARQGNVVLDVQYRLSPKYQWPTHLIDVKNAIRWLRLHADQYHIDPHRIALLGRSAGAQIALMAAFTPCDPAYPPPAELPERDDVQAVIALYPPTDIPTLQEEVRGTLSPWLGSRFEDRPDVYIAASPLYAVKSDPPPVLLAHGVRDNLVTPQHSVRLHRRLREAGGHAVLLTYPWGRHGFDFSLLGLGGQMLQYDMDRFLVWALRRENQAN